MGQSVRMTMMGSFQIFIDERRVENPVSKSRKGTALMEYLVLHRGASVTNQQLMQELWPERRLCRVAFCWAGVRNRLSTSIFTGKPPKRFMAVT